MVGPAQAGQRVGNYILEEEAGRGTFGIVFRAHHHAFTNRVVAVKIPTSSEYVRELKRDGTIQHQLEHPNIAQVIDLDVTSTPPYLVVEWLENGTLGSQIDEGEWWGLGDSLGLWIISEVLTALDFSHNRGVIHRDLSPSNIMFDGDWNVKVMDFGLGVVDDRVKRSLLVSGTQETSRIAGTLAYMSPEQQAGESLDSRSDLYSVGTILFQMLMGRLPALNDEISLARHREVTPPFRRRIEDALNSLYRGLCCPLERRIGSAAIVIGEVEELAGLVGLAEEAQAAAERTEAQAAAERAAGKKARAEAERPELVRERIVGGEEWGPYHMTSPVAMPVSREAEPEGSIARHGSTSEAECDGTPPRTWAAEWREVFAEELFAGAGLFTGCLALPLIWLACNAPKWALVGSGLAIVAVLLGAGGVATARYVRRTENPDALGSVASVGCVLLMLSPVAVCCILALSEYMGW